MYIRTTQRRNADGSAVRYVQVAHNKRVDGVTRAEVLVNLGREDQLDEEGLRRLVQSINRYLRGSDSGETTDGLDALDGFDALSEPAPGQASATSEAVRMLAETLWAELGVADAITDSLPDGDLSDAIDALQTAVAVRLAHWLPGATTGVAAPPPAAVRLAERGSPDVLGRIQRALLPLVMEREGLGSGPALAKAVAIGPGPAPATLGLTLDDQGLPLATWLSPDGDVSARRAEERLAEVGVTADVLVIGEEPGASAVFAVKAQPGDEWAEEALSRQGRYQEIGFDVRIKEVGLEGSDLRWIVGHDGVADEADRRARASLVARLERELERIGAAWGRRTDPLSAEERAMLQAAERSIRQHPVFGAWVRPQSSGRLRINRARLGFEERFDGKFLLAISDPAVPAADAALGHVLSDRARARFASMAPIAASETTLHPYAPEVQTAVLVEWLSLLLVAVVEHRTQRRWERVLTALTADPAEFVLPSARPAGADRLPAGHRRGSEAERPPASGPRRRAPGEGRKLLLDAARAVFAERGYSGASTREIADRAGVAEALLFRNFGTKAELFAEVAVAPVREFVDSWKAYEDSRPGGETDEELSQAFIGQFYDVLREHRRLLFAYVMTSAFDPEVAPLERTPLFQDTMSRLATWSGLAVDRRHLRRVNPTISNGAVVGMIFYMALSREWLPAAGSGRGRDEIVAQMSRLVLDGVAGNEPVAAPRQRRSKR